MFILKFQIVEVHVGAEVLPLSKYWYHIVQSLMLSLRLLSNWKRNILVKLCGNVMSF